MKNITFLKPIGATFSNEAYDALAEIYDTPKVSDTNYLPADSNGEVLKLISGHGGYGAIAMETLAEGRVAEPLESFIELLQMYPTIEDCPFRIVGAARRKIHFCLMSRESTLPEIPLGAKILMHPKAQGPCQKSIARINLPVVTVSSNGEAARLVAESNEYATSVALGPRSAAEKYRLHVLDGSFEDEEAITTFFLIAPAKHGVVTGKENRVLIVFKVPHRPGALARALLPFEQECLNLIQIHSVHSGNGTYHFAVEIEVKESQLSSLGRAMRLFENHIDSYLPFGPFEIRSE